MAVFSQIRPLNLREQVAEQIRIAIIEGRLKPNDHIIEANLTAQLGVSRTPVREALVLLEREELIVSIPNRGFFVRAFDEKEITDLFSMRTTLENFAAELVIEKLMPDDYAQLTQLIEQQSHFIQLHDFKQVRSADMSFHQYLVNASGHPLLMRSWQEIVAQVAAVLYLRAEAIPDIDETRAISDHNSILSAYMQKNLEMVKSENRRINQRVESQCIEAVRLLRSSSITQP